ncbi:hypothetical protein SK128_006593 [Halocaridina rubra]|uniref:Uncharacterized protein n=1 Tax=Halocaridina rubra TaxID=373956 RepID=A0AAN8XIN1_HALRR
MSKPSQSRLSPYHRSIRLDFYTCTDELENRTRDSLAALNANKRQISRERNNPLLIQVPLIPTSVPHFKMSFYPCKSRLAEEEEVKEDEEEVAEEGEEEELEGRGKNAKEGGRGKVPDENKEER